MDVRWFALALAVALTGCETGSRIQPVAEQPVIRVTDQASAAAIQFSRVVVDLPYGAQIGTYLEGVSVCATPGTLMYRGGRMSFDDRELTETFGNELRRGNYKVVGDPDALFDDPSSWEAEYLVAGLVKRIDADLCYVADPWQQVTKTSGAALMDVEWQIYSRRDRKVVHQLRTQGRGELRAGSTTGEADVLLAAFAQATRNLLADRQFHDLVAGEATATQSARTLPAGDLVLAPRKPFAGAIAGNIDSVRNGVVTILAGGSHGSGFFIDDAGHLLTNAHVVGRADRLQIVLAGGVEATARVLASDPRRDVALLKADLAKTGGLPLRLEPPAVGAEVYAMGSPLDPSLSATLSKGIVSALRHEDGLNYIQSDVNVMGGSSGGPLLDESGNVVGMTVAGIQAGDVALGLNYFIPILEALQRLGIRFGGTS